MARAVARSANGLLALIIAAALVAQIVLLLRGGQDANSGADSTVGHGTAMIRLFSYFTIQSNVLVLAGCAVLAARPDADGLLFRVLRLDSLLGITITGLVFALVLARQVHPTGLAAWCNAAFHYVSPWATVALWLLFGPRPRIGRGILLVAMIWPVLWLGWTFAHGAVSGWYPYPFLDVTRTGYAVAVRNTGVVVLTAVVLAALFAGLDRLPTALRRRRRT